MVERQEKFIIFYYKQEKFIIETESDRSEEV